MKSLKKNTHSLNPFLTNSIVAESASNRVNTTTNKPLSRSQQKALRSLNKKIRRKVNRHRNKPRKEVIVITDTNTYYNYLHSQHLGNTPRQFLENYVRSTAVMEVIRDA